MKTELSSIQKLNEPNKRELGLLLEEKSKRKKEKKWDKFVLHKWQTEVLEKTNDPYIKELMVCKGNRVGGTTIAAFFVFVWATGLYDQLAFDWVGQRLEEPMRLMIVGYDAAQLRGGLQRVLFGEGKPWGVGKEDDVWPIFSREICEESEFAMSSDNRGCMDYVRIPNYYGGFSTIYFKTQSQDFGNIMGDIYHIITFDEFPWNELLVSQLRPRIFDSKGFIFFNGTPEKRDGHPPSQKLLRRFMFDKPKDPAGHELTYLRKISMYEAEHLTKESVDNYKASLEEWEIPYRIYGNPVYGDQLVFKYAIDHEDNVAIDYEHLPEFADCKHICGLDWGMSDWGAIIWVMIDHLGNYYVWNAKRIRDLDPITVAAAIRVVDNQVGFSIPVVCGRDVGIKLPGKGKPLSIREMMRDEKVNMYPKAAYNAFTKGDSNIVLTGLLYLCHLMKQGKLKISKSPMMYQLWEEVRTCYLKNGDVAKRSESRFDSIEALRYAVIMGRFALHSINSNMSTGQRFAKTSYSIYNKR